MSHNVAAEKNSRNNSLYSQVHKKIEQEINNKGIRRAKQGGKKGNKKPKYSLSLGKRGNQTVMSTLGNENTNSTNLNLGTKSKL